MQTMINKLEFRIEAVQFKELDNRWKTVNFNPISRIIPLNRLYLPIEGYGTITQDCRVFNITPGKMLLIPAYAKVNLDCPARLVKYWTHFNAFSLGTELDIFSFFPYCCEIEVKDQQFTRYLFSRLVAIYSQGNSPSPVDQFEAEAALSLLLVDFLNIITVNNPQRKSAEAVRFSQLLSYIEKNISRPLTLKDFGHVVSRNPNYVSNMFKRKMGIPLMQFCNQRRIQTAIRYFQNTDHSVYEVADLVGINNASNFTKMFKRYTGTPPLKYKKEVVLDREKTSIAPL